MTISRRNINKAGFSALALAAAGLALAGCSSTTTQSFTSNENSRVESSQIAVGADFGKYDTLNAVDMGIFFPFISRLDGYDVVRDQTGPTPLTAEATLIDFRNATADDVMAVRNELRNIAAPGSLVFLMELKDSRSGEVLGRAADSTGAATFSTSADTDADWAAVETAAAHWAELFRQFLDENLNQ